MEIHLKAILYLSVLIVINHVMYLNVLIVINHVMYYVQY